MLELIVTALAGTLTGVLIGGFIEWNNAQNLHDDMLDRIDDLTRWNGNQEHQISEKHRRIKVLEQENSLLLSEVQRLKAEHEYPLETA